MLGTLDVGDAANRGKESSHHAIKPACLACSYSVTLLTMRRACWLMRACCVAAICMGSGAAGMEV